MRKSPLALASTIILALLVACGQADGSRVESQSEDQQAPVVEQTSPVGEADEVTSPESAVRAETPIPTDTPTPSILTYQVQVDCPVDETMGVDLIYTGLKSQEIDLGFNRGGFHWDEAWPDQKDSILVEMNAYGPDGKELPLSATRSGDKNNYIFTVDSEGSDSVRIHYRVNVGFWEDSGEIFQGSNRLGGYVGPNYCVIEPALLFLVPTNIEGEVDIVRAAFAVPESWEVVTFWAKDGEYYLSSPHALRLAKGPFGFGKFTVRREMFGNTRVVAAAAEGIYQPEIELDTAIDLYNYYRTHLFGDSDEYTYNSAPRDGYIAIFIPAQGPFYNMYHEEYGLYMSPFNQSWDNFAHMLSHNWTEEQNYSGSSWMVTEGFVEYLQVKVTLEQGYITQKRYREHLLHKYNWYSSIVGTENDRSIDDAFSRIVRGTSDSYDVDIQYHKGALVALLLDEALLRMSGGETDIQDLMHSIYEEAFVLRNSDSGLDTHRVEELTSELSGYDFAPFYEAYVSGIERLPLFVDSAGNLIVDDERLVPMDPLVSG